MLIETASQFFIVEILTLERFSSWSPLQTSGPPFLVALARMQQESQQKDHAAPLVESYQQIFLFFSFHYSDICTRKLLRFRVLKYFKIDRFNSLKKWLKSQFFYSGDFFFSRLLRKNKTQNLGQLNPETIGKRNVSSSDFETDCKMIRKLRNSF